MTVARMYRLSLYLLPAELRRKHGANMEALFLRELALARARRAGWYACLCRGRADGTLAVCAKVPAVWLSRYSPPRPASP